MDIVDDIKVRQCEVGDVRDVSRIIINNLMVINVIDYGKFAAVQLARFYTPALVLDYARHGEMYVAVERNQIVGTATLEDNRVRNVFVHIGRHRRGIGRILMQHIEEMARQRGKKGPILHANISAVDFYRKHGYEQVGEVEERIGDARIKMISMQKALSVAPS